MKCPTPKNQRETVDKEDIKTLKALVREKAKTSVIARKLKRTGGAMRATALGARLAMSRRKARAGGGWRRHASREKQ